MADNWWFNKLVGSNGQRFKELPEGVGAETELLGGPDEYHPNMDLPRWKGQIPEIGLAPEMPNYGTPEIGLAPEMPNDLMAKSTGWRNERRPDLGLPPFATQAQLEEALYQEDLRNGYVPAPGGGLMPGPKTKRKR